jgi:hypothetical protein
MPQHAEHVMFHGRAFCYMASLNQPALSVNGIPATQRIDVSDGQREGRPLSDDT